MVAEYVGITASYLSNLVLRYVGMKFVDYLNEVRIDHACTYLRQNYLKNYEIAYKVGFRDENIFQVFHLGDGADALRVEAGKMWRDKRRAKSVHFFGTLLLWCWDGSV